MVFYCFITKSSCFWDVWRSSRELKGLKFFVERLNSILLPPQGMFWGCGGRLRLLEDINDQRMQKWYNFHPKVTYNSSALSSNIILKLILRLLEVIWDCLRSFEVILLCKSLVEGVSDIKLSLCIRQLDLLCLYFHEHVIEAKVEAEKSKWSKWFIFEIRCE